MSDSAPTREFVALQSAVAGRFSLEHELGRGGMGIVFLARDVALERPVAIKLLPPVLADLPEFRERFLQEARTAAQLSHPNIVAVYTVEDHDEVVFFVMAFVEGETLGQRLLRVGRLPPSQGTRLIQEVAWALAYAHSRDVVHRDVKPDNILIDRGSGRAMVTDFGIARAAEAATTTIPGEVLGTAAYMSPEQAAGETVDGRSDLYSLGVTGFYALTGRLPFEARTPLAMLGMQVWEPAPAVRTVEQSVPLNLAQTVDRCLAKDPEARFQTGEELAEALAAAGTSIKEVPPAVRHYLRTIDRAVVTTALIFSIWILFGQFVHVQFVRGPVPFLMYATGFFTIVVWPWTSAFESARRALKADLSFGDVVAAMAGDARARQEERDATHRDAITRLMGAKGRRRRLTIALQLALWTGLLVFFGLRPSNISWEALGGLTVGITVLAALMGFAGSNPRLRAKVSEEAESFPGERAIRSLHQRFGVWFFRLAGLGLKTPQISTPLPAQHTEVLLARASDALLNSLPVEQREHLAEAPEIIGRLESDAERLRARRDELLATMAEVGGQQIGLGAGERSVVTELKLAGEAVESRLASAVGALENIRLDLLRLKAGLGSLDDLTADLDAAWELSEKIGSQAAAVDELADKRNR